MRPIRVLTWHVHGNYLLYLSQARVEFYLPVAPGRPGHGGRGTTFPFPDRVRDIPVEQLRELEFDCVLFQSRQNYLIDQHEILTRAQRSLPRIYLEHDPPQEHPTDTRHPVDDPDTLLVHVTPFNDLMWDSGRTPTRVIEHGVFVPDDARYSGELDRGIVVVNHLKRRGRRLGADVFERVRNEVPLDLVGMDAESLGGLGEVAPGRAGPRSRRVTASFSIPIRYTSLGLAVIEAMMIGLPIVGLATTEMRDGRSKTAFQDSSRPTSAGSSSDARACWPIAGRPVVWARTPRRAAWNGSRSSGSLTTGKTHSAPVIGTSSPADARWSVT